MVPDSAIQDPRRKINQLSSSVVNLVSNKTHVAHKSCPLSRNSVITSLRVANLSPIKFEVQSNFTNFTNTVKVVKKSMAY